MDFLESLHAKFLKLHKKNNITTDITELRKTRVEEQRLFRIKLRSKMMDERRHLEHVETRKAPKKASPQVDRRRDKLLIWKQEREKKKEQEKKKMKPIFKLGSATNVGFPILNENLQSFAPSKHVFKPPKNVKPIPFQQDKNVPSQRVTRSQKSVHSPPLELPQPTRKKRDPIQKKDNGPRKLLTENKQIQMQKDKPKRKSTEKRGLRKIFKSDSDEKENSPRKNKNMQFEKPKRKSIEKRRKLLPRNMFKSDSEESQILTENESKPIRNNRNIHEDKKLKTKSPGKRRRSLRKSILKSDSEESQKLTETEHTPKNNGVYVSPFVTTSRGKGSVRKENLDRSLRGLPAFSDRKSLAASGASYFTNILSKEIIRLEDLCRTWVEYKKENRINDDAKDLIDVAVGQATLLMNKKFKQFEGLIKSCETGVGAEKEVTCDDLQGFWDMIYMQVENLNARFNRLTTMKNNNWQEIEQAVKIKVVKKRAPVKASKPAASSGIRAAILAARKKKLDVIPPTTDTEESVFNGGFFVIKTPQKNTPNRKSPKTPKSILKSNKTKLVPNLNKSVLFKEESDNE